MFDFFRKSICWFVPFNENELLQFTSCLSTLQIKKKKYFLTQGQDNKNMAFINKGGFRYFYMKDGSEYTRKFFSPGAWVGDYPAFLKQQPAGAYVEAITDAELFLLSYDNMQKLYSINQKFERFGRLIAEYIYTDMAETNASLLMDSPEERYFKLMKKNPDVFKSGVPLYQIASYLGIKPESLSRIRKRTLNCHAN